MQQTKRAFTLIELLVVIAIIGTLSSIVLSSLNSARNKGVDATVKSNLNSARTQVELFYDLNGNRYDITPAGGTNSVCDPNGVAGGVKSVHANVLAAAQSSGLSSVNSTIGTAGTVTTATCHACWPGQASTDCLSPLRDGWAAEAPLKTQTGVLWCVDSSGKVGTTTTPLGAGDTKCG